MSAVLSEALCGIGVLPSPTFASGGGSVVIGAKDAMLAPDTL
jgi:hypothetical protein